MNAKRRIVTHHVIAEVHGILNRVDEIKNNVELFWRTAIELLVNSGIEEIACGLQDLRDGEAYEKMLLALGPCDEGVARTAEHHHAILLSDDGALCSWANKRGIQTLNLKGL